MKKYKKKSNANKIKLINKNRKVLRAVMTHNTKTKKNIYICSPIHSATGFKNNHQ